MTTQTRRRDPDGTASNRAAKEAMPRSTLPDAPCFLCGDRGWCRHRQPDPAPSPSIWASEVNKDRTGREEGHG